MRFVCDRAPVTAGCGCSGSDGSGLDGHRPSGPLHSRGPRSTSASPAHPGWHTRLVSADTAAVAAATGERGRCLGSTDVAQFPAKQVLLLSAIVVVGLTMLNARYGFHGDEMYLSWLGGRPAWGYVASAQPPIVPMVAHGVDTLSGQSLVAMRLLAAMAVGVVVVCGALLTRELGGSTRAQLIGAVAMACVPAVRGPAVIWTAVAADLVVWSVVLVLAARLLRTGNERLWLWLGLAVGAGLETKWTVVLLVLGLGVALLVSPHRHLLRSPLLPVGVAIALVLWAPNLWWQATHDWPFLDYSESVSEKNGAIETRATFLPTIWLLLTGVAATPVALRGLRWLARGRSRPLALAIAVVVVIVFVTGGRTYFVAPVAIPVFAAAAMATDAMDESQRRRTVATLVLTAVLTLPLTSPVLPPRLLDAVEPVNPYMLDMIGWPELVDDVRTAFHDVASRDRGTVVLAENFATASALLRYAPELDVYSAEHDFWYLGPPPSATSSVLTVGYGYADVASWCDAPEQIGSVENKHGVDNAQAGWPILYCRRPRQPWPALWGTLRSFG